METIIKFIVAVILTVCALKCYWIGWNKGDCFPYMFYGAFLQLIAALISFT